MALLNIIEPFTFFQMVGLITLSLWTMIWKGVGLFKSARLNHRGWFITMLIFNTAGIIPILYLIINGDKKW